MKMKREDVCLMLCINCSNIKLNTVSLDCTGLIELPVNVNAVPRSEALVFVIDIPAGKAPDCFSNVTTRP